jgi:hypothetical protein
MALDAILLARIMFITGILNIIFIILIALTCRCIGMNKMTRGLINKKWFLKLYDYHCYYWYLFFISVIIHAVAGFYLFGMPF